MARAIRSRVYAAGATREVKDLNVAADEVEQMMELLDTSATGVCARCCCQIQQWDIATADVGQAYEACEPTPVVESFKYHCKIFKKGL